MLATAINEKQAEIKTLSDQLQYLVSIKNRIIETCNRKLYRYPRAMPVVLKYN